MTTTAALPSPESVAVLRYGDGPGAKVAFAESDAVDGGTPGAS